MNILRLNRFREKIIFVDTRVNIELIHEQHSLGHRAFVHYQVRLELTGAELVVAEETRPDLPQPTQARARSTSPGG